MQFNPKLFLFGIVSMAITSYILLGAYSVVFIQPIPVVNAITKANSSHLISVIAENEGAKATYSLPNESKNASRQPRLLKIPKTNTKLNIIKALSRDGVWYCRPGDGQFLFLTDKSNKLLDILIYADQNWRTIADSQEIAVGDNIFISTDSSYQYIFRVASKSTISTDDSYIPDSADTLGLILLLEDSEHDVVHVYRARMLDAQEVL